jgi:hypothetical protein
VDAEELSRVRHSDISFLDKALQPTEKIVLDPNDYVFCRRASESIRRIGFDSVELYPEPNAVEFQIRDGMGRDNGIRYIYYFYPARTLPDEFMYDQQLDTDWYFARQPRFAD